MYNQTQSDAVDRMLQIVIESAFRLSAVERNQSNHNGQSEQRKMSRDSSNHKRLQARENASDPVAIGYNLAYDWSRDWHKCSGLIIRRS